MSLHNAIARTTFILSQKGHDATAQQSMRLKSGCDLHLPQRHPSEGSSSDGQFKNTCVEANHENPKLFETSFPKFIGFHNAWLGLMSSPRWFWKPFFFRWEVQSHAARGLHWLVELINKEKVLPRARGCRPGHLGSTV